MTARRETRLSALDGLRGAAALLVLVHHALFVLLPPPLPRETMRLVALTPAAPLIDGQPLVIVFFVLSGLVLTVALERPIGWIAFALRRVVRLWLPLAAAVLLAVALALLTGGRGSGAGYADWFMRVIWNRPEDITPGLVLRHLLLTGRLSDEGLDTVIWSLAIELRLSLAMPALAFAIRRWPAATVAAATAIGIAAELALHGTLPGFRARLQFQDGLFLIDDWTGTALATLAILPAFAFGALLAVHRRDLLAARPGTGRTAILLAAAAIGLGAPSVVACSLAAAILVATVLTDGPARRMLSRPAALWLGAISYPLYLTHFPILHAAINMLGDSLPRALVMTAGMAAAVAVAAGFRRAVEAPAIALSRRLGGR